MHQSLQSDDVSTWGDTAAPRGLNLSNSPDSRGSTSLNSPTAGLPCRTLRKPYDWLASLFAARLNALNSNTDVKLEKRSSLVTAAWLYKG